MTPPLLNMLDNELLQERYIKYLEKHIELAEKEVERTTYDQKLNNFRASLGSAISKGENISFADRDISYGFKLQHDRLIQKGMNVI